MTPTEHLAEQNDNTNQTKGQIDRETGLGHIHGCLRQPTVRGSQRPHKRQRRNHRQNETTYSGLALDEDKTKIMDTKRQKRFPEGHTYKYIHTKHDTKMKKYIQKHDTKMK